MKVGVSVLGHVVVEDNVDSLNVHTTAKQVGGDQDSLLEIFELLVSGQPLLLSHASVDSNGGEILFYQQLGQCYTSLNRLDKNNNLEIK